MNRSLLRTLLIVVALVSLTFYLYSMSSSKSIDTVVETDGSVIESYTTEPLAIKSLKGKVHIVNFWATWCGPCRIEIPELIELKKHYKGQAFEIIGVSVDDTDSPVKRYVKETDFNYPVVMFSAFFEKNFGSPRAIPTTFIIDKDMNVVKIIEGYQTSDYIKKIIDDLLNI